MNIFCRLVVLARQVNGPLNIRAWHRSGGTRAKKKISLILYSETGKSQNYKTLMKKNYTQMGEKSGMIEEYVHFDG